MDILDFTLTELQKLLSTPAKARQYLAYLEHTPCLFLPSGKERAYLEHTIGRQQENHLIWKECAALRSKVIRTLRKSLLRECSNKSDSSEVIKYINAERALLNAYHVNKTMREKISSFSCFHSDETEYPHTFPISLAFNKDYQKELRSHVYQSYITSEPDYSAKFTALTSANLVELLNYQGEREAMVSALENDMPLHYVLEDYCNFYVSHSLAGMTLETMLDEEVKVAFQTISFSYGLQCQVNRVSVNPHDGWCTDQPAIFSVRYYLEEVNMEKLYMKRLLDCNNTLIFSH